MSQENVPMPPPSLAKRVGLWGAEDLYAAYEQVGIECREQILRMLRPGYELEGRRLLDFGCGAGRTLRHFLDEANSAEVWGCDIDADSIDWLERHLCPPLHVLRNEPEPGLPFEDGHFDLVWALSVFTHIVETWAGWLLELHRVLADDGILVASTLGPHQSERLANEAWEGDRVGMNALRHPGSGGPIVFHSTWWLHAHWGRAFEIFEIDESPVAGKQRWLAMRKRDVILTVADLERADPGEPREFTALRHNIQQLLRERDERAQRLREQNRRLREQNRRLREQNRRLREQAQRPREQAPPDMRLREQQKLLRAMLGSRAFAIAEQLSRLHQRGKPVFSRQEIRRALGDDASA